VIFSGLLVCKAHRGFGIPNNRASGSQGPKAADKVRPEFIIKRAIGGSSVALIILILNL